MKIYAYQEAPENTISPLTWADLDENILLYGNRHLRDHGGAAELLRAIAYAAEGLVALENGHGWHNNFIEIITDFLPVPEHKSEYSRADRLQWRQLLLNYYAAAINDDDAITAAMELKTGKQYDAATLRGCCQGDWQNIIYPLEYGDKWLRYFEIEYFNTGNEWRIIEDNDEGSAYYFYTHERSDDGTRAEIAAAAGVDPANVVLYVFDGWSRTPLYKEV